MGLKWSLDPKEVTFSALGGSSGRKGRRFNRRLRVSSFSLVLKHVPSGLEVKGEVSQGHYSKKEMQERKAELYLKLFKELEGKVAKYLRVPGR